MRARDDEATKLFGNDIGKLHVDSLSPQVYCEYKHTHIKTVTCHLPNYIHKNASARAGLAIQQLYISAFERYRQTSTEQMNESASANEWPYSQTPNIEYER